MFIIAGLGNPGSQYQMTRHNAGFDALDFLAAQYRLTGFRVKHRALVTEGNLQGERVMLVKPQTYMNNSGESIRELVDYYKVPLDHLIVLYDDIDLDCGKLRIRAKGSAGTHNGMRSIISHLKADDFPRIRIGVGKPPEHMALADFVLSRFTGDERILVNGAIEKAALAAATIVCASIDTAMNRYNS